MSLSFNPTQISGIVAFSLAFFCCLLAARAPVWRMLAVLHLAFAAEIWFGFRHAFRAWLNEPMLTVGLYEYRLWLQVGLLFLVAIVSVCAARIARRTFATTAIDAPGKIAIAATGFVLFLFALELISVHMIDARLYALRGSIMVIGWIWMISATLVSIMAIRSRQLVQA